MPHNPFLLTAAPLTLLPCLSPLDLLIFLPIFAAVAMAFGAPARMTAIGAAGLNLANALSLAAQFEFGSAAFQFTAVRPVLASPAMGFNVGIDGMSLVMVLLTVAAPAVVRCPMMSLPSLTV